MRTTSKVFIFDQRISFPNRKVSYIQPKKIFLIKKFLRLTEKLFTRLYVY